MSQHTVDLQPIGTLPGGLVVYERETESGETAQGVLMPATEQSMRRATQVATACERLPDGRLRLTVTRFTARGPSQVASSAYRSGWDAVFGERKGGDECGAPRPN